MNDEMMMMTWNAPVCRACIHSIVGALQIFVTMMMTMMIKLQQEAAVCT